VYVEVIWFDFIHVGHHAVSCARQKPQRPIGCKIQGLGCSATSRDVCKILHNLKPVKLAGGTGGTGGTDGTDGTDINEVGG
jgi:hypothetical protein